MADAYKARIIKSYEKSNADPIAVRNGDWQVVGRQDDEYPGWTWCTGPDGREGWMPETYIERVGDGGTGLARQDYNARELTAETGERVEVAYELNSWAWCTNERGESGWLPTANIERLA